MGATAQTKPGRWEPLGLSQDPGMCFRPKTPGGPLQRCGDPGCLPRMWIPRSSCPTIHAEHRRRLPGRAGNLCLPRDMVATGEP